jgi:hypothetical protein
MNNGTHRIRTQLAILDAVVGNPVLCPGRIDAPVNDGQRDVHALGAVLAGDGLGDGALGEFAGGKGGEAGGAAEGGGCAGDDEGGRVRRRGPRGSGEGGLETGKGLLGEKEEALTRQGSVQFRWTCWEIVLSA